MSYTVKAESISDLARPPAYYEVEDSEVTVKNRQVRSDKPEEYYHLSPGKTTKGPDDTIPLSEKVIDSVTTTPDTSSSALSSSPWESDIEFLNRINAHSTLPAATEVHSLGAEFDITVESPTIVITEDASASFSIPPSAPPIPITTTAEASSDVNTDTPSAATTFSGVLVTASAPLTTTTTVTTFSTSTVELVVTPSVATSAPHTSVQLSNPSLVIVPTTGSLVIAPVVGPVPPSDGGEHDNSSENDPAGVNHVDVSDSESEVDMDPRPNNGFNPSTFKGLTTENAKEWLAYFEKYCAYKEYNEATIMALFKVLLVDSASVWHDSLPNETSGDWNRLKAAFETRYNPPGFMRYQHANDLFNMKESEMSVEDFLRKDATFSKGCGSRRKHVTICGN